MAIINPAEYEILLKVKLKYPGPQTPPPSATQCASDAQTAIAADSTINAESVEVEAFVPSGSGQ
jgi:hypothetical protein